MGWLVFLTFSHGVHAHSLAHRPGLHGFHFLGLKHHEATDQSESDLADHEPTPVNASRERRVNQIKYRIDQSGPDKWSHYSAKKPFQACRKHRQKDSVEQSYED